MSPANVEPEEISDSCFSNHGGLRHFRGADCQGCAFRAEEGACERKSNCLLVPESKSKRSFYGTAAGSFRRVPLASGRARSVAMFQRLGMIGIVDVCRICPFSGTPLAMPQRTVQPQDLRERLPSVAAPMARRTVRVAEIVRLFGHAAGGLPSERLLARLACRSATTRSCAS